MFWANSWMTILSFLKSFFHIVNIVEKFWKLASVWGIITKKGFACLKCFRKFIREFGFCVKHYETTKAIYFRLIWKNFENWVCVGHPLENQTFDNFPEFQKLFDIFSCCKIICLKHIILAFFNKYIKYSNSFWSSS